MTNLEYLEKVKKSNEDIENDISRIRNKDYPLNVGWAKEAEINLRKVKALEIIAEELITINESFRWLNRHSLF